jgi:hypothetical protein
MSELRWPGKGNKIPQLTDYADYADFDLDNENSPAILINKICVIV